MQSATVDLVDFFSGLDVEDNWHDARVDPFEPSRVWITTRPSVKVVGPLECFGVKVRRLIGLIYRLSNINLRFERWLFYMVDPLSYIPVYLSNERERAREVGQWQ